MGYIQKYVDHTLDTLEEALRDGTTLTESDLHRAELLRSYIVNPWLMQTSRLNSLLEYAIAMNKLPRFMDLVDKLYIFKMWRAMGATEQNPKYHPEGDVAIHTTLVLIEAKVYNREVKLAALAHDFGKPFSYFLHGNTYDHHVSGIQPINDFCNVFGLSQDDRRLMLTVCQYHIRAHEVTGRNALSPAKLLELLDHLDYASEDQTFFQNCLNAFRCDLKGRGGDTDVGSVYYLEGAAEALRRTKGKDRDSKLFTLRRYMRSREVGARKDKTLLLPLGSGIGVEHRNWLMEELNERQLDIIAVVIVGSKAQGLETEKSDTDLVCIYKPDYLEPSNLKAVSNPELELQLGFRNVESFITGVSNADLNVIDLLWADTRHVIYSTPTWDKVVRERRECLAKDMPGLTSFLSASYYEFIERDEELLAVTKFLEVLKRNEERLTYEDCGRYVTSTGSPRVWLEDDPGKEGKYLVRIYGRSYNLHTPKAQFIDAIEKRLKKLNLSVRKQLDDKALAHSIRAAWTYVALFQSGGNLAQLLSDAQKATLVDIKRGKYTRESIIELLKVVDTQVKNAKLELGKFCPEPNVSAFIEIFNQFNPKQ